MIITNLKIYDFEESMLASGYAMMVDIPQGEERKDEISEVALDVIMRNEGNNKHIKRGMRLVKAPLNSGHPNFLSGILVSMDVTFSNKVWTEWQRYHFQQIVTSQSCMHKISKFDLDEAFVEYTDKVIIEILKEIQEQYNNEPTAENYLRLLYSTPSGIKLTARVSTNYLQLMTMYKQRHNHRLPEWREFCEELVEQLPMFKEFLEVNGK